MINHKIIHGISPVLIYESHNENNDEIKKIFHKNISKYGFSVEKGNRDGVTAASGEYLGKSFLHHDQNFGSFFSFIKENIKNYVKSMGFDDELFSYHILKSWYVIITDNNGMGFHSHSSSDFSFTYYVDIPEGSSGIKFLNQNMFNKNNIFSGLFGNETTSYIKDFNNPHVFESYYFRPSNGKLLIFPSSLEHAVDSCEMGVVRYAIAGDIKLSLNKNIINFESGLIHPSFWREL